RGPACRVDPREQTTADHSEPHAIAAAEVPRGDRGRLVDDLVQRGLARASRGELARRVEEQEHDVALFALVFADEQLAAARGGLPGDAPERVARLVLAELTDVAALSGERAGASLIRVPPASSATRRARQPRIRLGHHLDAAGVREGERHLEEPR